MECFKIEWKGLYSFAEVQNQSEAKEAGIYAIYRKGSKDKNPAYVGKSQEPGKRVSQHNQGWSRILPEKELEKHSVCLGTIYSLEGSRVSSQQLHDIESFLINSVKP